METDDVQSEISKLQLLMAEEEMKHKQYQVSFDFYVKL